MVHAVELPDFRIAERGSCSRLFLERGLSNFQDAALYVRALPYRRTSVPRDCMSVLREGCGTCSGKHALLASLAEEQAQPVDLLLGIFALGPQNSPRLAPILSAYELEFIPECHAYLRWKGRRLDFTGERFPLEPADAFLNEEQVAPAALAACKDVFHKRFLEEWLARSGLAARFDLQTLWAVREECIAALIGST